MVIYNMSAYYKLGHVVCYVITELYRLSFLYKSINSTYTSAYSDKNDTGRGGAPRRPRASQQNGVYCLDETRINFFILAFLIEIK